MDSPFNSYMALHESTTVLHHCHIRTSSTAVWDYNVSQRSEKPALKLEIKCARKREWGEVWVCVAVEDRNPKGEEALSARVRSTPGPRSCTMVSWKVFRLQMLRYTRAHLISSHLIAFVLYSYIFRYPKQPSNTTQHNTTQHVQL